MKITRMTVNDVEKRPILIHISKTIRLQIMRIAAINLPIYQTFSSRKA